MKRFLIVLLSVFLTYGMSASAETYKAEFEEIAIEICEMNKELQRHRDELVKSEKEILLAADELREKAIILAQAEAGGEHILLVQASEIPGVKMPPESFLRHNRGRNGSKSRLMIIYRLVDQLDLDEDTATKFFPIYLTYINSRDKLIKERRELVHRVAEDADDESVSIKELKKNVAKLKEYEKSIEKERETFYDKAEKVLGERQYIKLIVFNDKLKEDLIARFRSERMSKSSMEQRRDLKMRMEEMEKQRDMMEKDK